jgi:hypothetical protein
MAETELELTKIATDLVLLAAKTHTDQSVQEQMYSVGGLIATTRAYRRLVRLLQSMLGNRLFLPNFPKVFPATFACLIVTQACITSRESSFAKQDAGNRGRMSCDSLVSEQCEELRTLVAAQPELTHWAELFVPSIDDLFETKDKVEDIFGSAAFFGRDPECVPNLIVAFVAGKELVDGVEKAKKKHARDLEQLKSN